MRTFLILATILALAYPAAADHCEGYTTSEPEFTIDASLAGGPTYYWDNDFVQPGCCFSVWIYEESNGIPGLQRGDELTDDTCHGSVPSDTIIF